MEAFEAEVRGRAIALAAAEGLEVGFDVSDPFPATVSDAGCVAKIEAAAGRLGRPVVWMEAPWRASEDFGHYTKRCPGAIFYVGNGANWPALHTPEYDFNDRILEAAVDMFREVYRGA